MIYIKEADINNENRIAKKLSESWKCEVVPTSEMVKYDFNIFKLGSRELIGAVEYKNRKNNQNAFPDLIIDKKKMDHLFYIKSFLGIHTVLVIEWQDFIGRLDTDVNTWAGFPKTLPYEAKDFARTKPRQDGLTPKIEQKLVYQIPINLFKEVI